MLWLRATHGVWEEPTIQEAMCLLVKRSIIHRKPIIKWCLPVSQVPNTFTQVLSGSCRPADLERHIEIITTLTYHSVQLIMHQPSESSMVDLGILYFSSHRRDLCLREFSFSALPTLPLFLFPIFLPSLTRHHLRYVCQILLQREGAKNYMPTSHLGKSERPQHQELKWVFVRLYLRNEWNKFQLKLSSSHQCCICLSNTLSSTHIWLVRVCEQL